MCTEWANEYVGIPFKWHGYDRKGCSCWGLVRLVLMERFHVTLPTHRDAVEAVRCGEEIPQSAWCGGIEVQELPPDVAFRAGDVVKMSTIIRGGRCLPLHVGVMVSPRHVLHVQRSTLSVIQNINDANVAARIKGVYRVV